MAGIIDPFISGEAVLIRVRPHLAFACFKFPIPVAIQPVKQRSPHRHDDRCAEFIQPYLVGSPGGHIIHHAVPAHIEFPEEQVIAPVVIRLDLTVVKLFGLFRERREIPQMRFLRRLGSRRTRWRGRCIFLSINRQGRHAHSLDESPEHHEECAVPRSLVDHDRDLMRLVP